MATKTKTKPRTKAKPHPNITKLNLGGGDLVMDGFTNIDRKNGKEVFPLAGVDDNSVDEIYASHVIEHFSHRKVSEVLNHWVAKLRPGGRIRIAVPNFKLIAEEYLAKKPFNLQGFVMGGHDDDDDFHRCILDAESLRELMMNSKLERIGHWKSEHADAASLAVSLNMQGFKPSSDVLHCADTAAVLSAPRFGPIIHMAVAIRAFAHAHVDHEIGQGAFWNQVLCKQIDRALKDESVRYVITTDYDTIFSGEDVVELYRLMEQTPEADAIASVQSKRGCVFALMGIADKDGKPRTEVNVCEFEQHLTRITTAHFGLTIFRASTLREFPKPWMVATPDSRGGWDGIEEGEEDKDFVGKVDADIDFWYRWRDAGLTLLVANRVVVGHLEETITWPSRPDKAFAPIHQRVVDFHKVGIPKEVVR